jgi:hypothetical protein
MHNNFKNKQTKKPWYKPNQGGEGPLEWKLQNLEEIENTRRWKDFPYSWIGKMAILLKTVYRFNAVPSTFQHHSSHIEKSILKFIWKHKDPK